MELLQVADFPSFFRQATKDVLNMRTLADKQLPRVYLHTQFIPDQAWVSNSL